MSSTMISPIVSSIAVSDSGCQLPHCRQDQGFHHDTMGARTRLGVSLSLAQLGQLWEPVDCMVGITGPMGREVFKL